MAHFYLSGDNSRGHEVTAAGSSRGQQAHLRGWNAGVKIVAQRDEAGRDYFEIYATGGSRGGSKSYLVGTITDLSNIGPVFTPVAEMACPGCGRVLEEGDHIEGGAILCVGCDVSSWSSKFSESNCYAGD